MQRSLFLVAAAIAAGRVQAATVLFCPFDDLNGWRSCSIGAARVELDGDAGVRRCAHIVARGGSAFLTRLLPLDAVRGERIRVRCSMKTRAVRPGPLACSAAKVHLAVRTPRGVRHYAARLTGDRDWGQQGFTADVPRDASCARLNIGLEACSGEAWFDTLVVTNDRRRFVPLDLSACANARRDRIGLAARLPATLAWNGAAFKLMTRASRDAPDCLYLRGVGHEDWPPSVGPCIRVNLLASKLYILHAALDGADMRETPCAIWTARFADGHEASFSIFEGREIGAAGRTRDAPNWRVAWRGKTPEGRLVTFGVTKWTLFGDTPILSLQCRSYRGAAPVVLAITAVEEPPPPPDNDADEEWY